MHAVVFRGMKGTENRKSLNQPDIIFMAVQCSAFIYTHETWRPEPRRGRQLSAAIAGL